MASNKDTANRTDPLTPLERSERMARVRNRGNASTETQVEAALIAAGVIGWEKHPKDVPGRPDFYFRVYRLAIFVDGCFWHVCPHCSRRVPRSRTDFWTNKLEENRRRDARTRRSLNRQGWHYIRIWEHEVKSGRWVARLQRSLDKLCGESCGEETKLD